MFSNLFSWQKPICEVIIIQMQKEELELCILRIIGSWLSDNYRDGSSWEEVGIEAVHQSLAFYCNEKKYTFKPSAVVDLLEAYGHNHEDIDMYEGPYRPDLYQLADWVHIDPDKHLDMLLEVCCESD